VKHGTKRQLSNLCSQPWESYGPAWTRDVCITLGMHMAPMHMEPTWVNLAQSQQLTLTQKH